MQIANQQRHLGIILDEKLNFKSHIDKVLTKASKGIAVIKRLRNSLPRKSLITIYKAIIRPHLDYGDILYDQPNNATFCQKIETFQYKAALAITGAIQGTSQEKILNWELGLETLKSRRWLRMLCCMYKIINLVIPKYLTNLIPKREIGYKIRNRNKSFFHCRTESFKNSFFPYTIHAWYSLDLSIINSNLLEVFKSKLLAFIQPVQRSIYNVFNPQGLKFLTRLRLGLSHLKEHRFRDNFKNCINPLCSCTVWK